MNGPWQVVVSDDNSMSSCAFVYALTRGLDCAPEEAVAFTVRAGREGSAVVAACDDRERAEELLVDLHCRGLDCRIEVAAGA